MQNKPSAATIESRYLVRKTMTNEPSSLYRICQINIYGIRRPKSDKISGQMREEKFHVVLLRKIKILSARIQSTSKNQTPKTSRASSQMQKLASAVRGITIINVCKTQTNVPAEVLPVYPHPLI